MAHFQGFIDRYKKVVKIEQNYDSSASDDELSYIEQRKLKKFVNEQTLAKHGLYIKNKSSTIGPNLKISVLGSEVCIDRAFIRNLERKGGLTNWLLHIFKSKACRHGIKFGDRLDAESCK